MRPSLTWATVNLDDEDDVARLEELETPRERNYVYAYDNTVFGFAPFLILRAESRRFVTRAGDEREVLSRARRARCIPGWPRPPRSEGRLSRRATARCYDGPSLVAFLMQPDGGFLADCG